MNKRKIINDPVYGFINISSEFIFDLIQHPYFQRLRNIHQLVSSQLDVDRLDYLNRDSFYTGVAEGVIGSDRIIKMLNVHNDQLVADMKAVYSIEKFIISRRLMYWQVYLHKTVHVVEVILTNILKRAQYLFENKKLHFVSPALRFFFEQKLSKQGFMNSPQALETFMKLDDNDILFCIKLWQNETDFVLSQLSKRLYNRHLFKIEVAEHPFEENYVHSISERTKKHFHFTDEECKYFVVSGKMENQAYNVQMESIQILDKNGKLFSLEEISDHLNHRTLSESVSKYFLCYPKEV
jgi:HD superfamily phosphohydrolase